MNELLWSLILLPRRIVVLLGLLTSSTWVKGSWVSLEKWRRLVVDVLILWYEARSKWIKIATLTLSISLRVKLGSRWITEDLGILLILLVAVILLIGLVPKLLISTEIISLMLIIVLSIPRTLIPVLIGLLRFFLVLLLTPILLVLLLLLVLVSGIVRFVTLGLLPVIRVGDLVVALIILRVSPFNIIIPFVAVGLLLQVLVLLLVVLFHLPRVETIFFALVLVLGRLFIFGIILLLLLLLVLVFLGLSMILRLISLILFWEVSLFLSAILAVALLTFQVLFLFCRISIFSSGFTLVSFINCRNERSHHNGLVWS